MPYRSGERHSGWHASVAKYHIHDVTKQSMTCQLHFDGTQWVVKLVSVLNEDDDGNLFEKQHEKFH